jgi:hypothetical protein
MVLGEVEETVTTVDIDEETMEEIVKVCTGRQRSSQDGGHGHATSTKQHHVLAVHMNP